MFFFFFLMSPTVVDDCLRSLRVIILPLIDVETGLASSALACLLFCILATGGHLPECAHESARFQRRAAVLVGVVDDELHPENPGYSSMYSNYCETSIWPAMSETFPNTRGQTLQPTFVYRFVPALEIYSSGRPGRASLTAAL